MLNFHRRATPFRMKGSPKKYSKDALLAVLRDQCPDALAKFPDPSTFTIDTLHAVPRLHIGHSVTKRANKVKGSLRMSFNTTSAYPRVCYIDDVGGHFKNIWTAEIGFKGNEFFSKLSDRDVVKSDSVQLLFAFIMLLRGYARKFETTRLGISVRLDF